MREKYIRKVSPSLFRTTQEIKDFFFGKVFLGEKGCCMFILTKFCAEFYSVSDFSLQKFVSDFNFWNIFLKNHENFISFFIANRKNPRFSPLKPLNDCRFTTGRIQSGAQKLNQKRKETRIKIKNFLQKLNFFQNYLLSRTNKVMNIS